MSTDAFETVGSEVVDAELVEFDSVDGSASLIREPTKTSALAIYRPDRLAISPRDRRLPAIVQSDGLLGILVANFTAKAQAEATSGLPDTVWNTPGPAYLIPDFTNTEIHMPEAFRRSLRVVCLPDNAPVDQLGAPTDQLGLVELGTVVITIELPTEADPDVEYALRMTFSSLQSARSTVMLSLALSLAPDVQQLFEQSPPGELKTVIVEAVSEDAQRVIAVHRDDIARAWGADKIILPNELRNSEHEMPKPFEELRDEFAEAVQELLPSHYNVRAVTLEDSWHLEFASNQSEVMELEIPSDTEIDIVHLANQISILDQLAITKPELRVKRWVFDPVSDKLRDLSDPFAFLFEPSKPGDTIRRLPLELIQPTEKRDQFLDRVLIAFNTVFEDEKISPEFATVWIVLLDALARDPSRLDELDRLFMDTKFVNLGLATEKLHVRTKSWVGKNLRALAGASYSLIPWEGNKDPVVESVVREITKRRPFGTIFSSRVYEPETTDRFRLDRPTPQIVDQNPTVRVIKTPSNDLEALEAERNARRVPSLAATILSRNGKNRFVDNDGSEYPMDPLTLPTLKLLEDRARCVTPGRDSHIFETFRHRLLAKEITGSTTHRVVNAHTERNLARRLLPYEQLLELSVDLGPDGILTLTVPDTFDLAVRRLHQIVNTCRDELRGLGWLGFRRITVAQQVDANAQSEEIAKAALAGEIILDGRVALLKTQLERDVEIDTDTQLDWIAPEIQGTSADIRYAIGYRLALETQKLLGTSKYRPLKKAWDAIVEPLTQRSVGKALTLDEVFDSSGLREHTRLEKMERRAKIIGDAGAVEDTRAGILAALYRLTYSEYTSSEVAMREALRERFASLIREAVAAKRLQTSGQDF